jgi:predicted Zn-dependent protease
MHLGNSGGSDHKTCKNALRAGKSTTIRTFHESIRKASALTLIVIFFLLVSCAPATSSRYREGSNVGQQTTMTVQDEQRLTQEALPEIKKDYPAAKNQDLQNYISTLGMKIVTANKLEGNPYHYTFAVVDVKDVNAFALPAGAIFVTAPLIAMTSNEAELAGVVGHEVGHVVARHAAERMYAMEKEKKKTWLYATGGGILGAAAGFGLGKLLCADDDKTCLVKAAAIGAAAGAGGGLLLQKYGFLVNSREDEMEADRIGFKLAVGAGYDKDLVGKFYEKLLDMEKKAKTSGDPMMKNLSDALSTHPPSEERVRQMNELAARIPAARNPLSSSVDYNRAKQTAAGLSKTAK